MRDAEFHDARLVAVYDAECVWGPDDDFFVSVVTESGGRHVLDLGCGTGRLALGLAERGFVVTGVDPAGASLAAARRKPGAGNVAWVEGTSPGLPGNAYDTAVMTSHVAQMFTTDEAWDGVLRDLRRALVAGGRLAFDTRDPRARAWEGWDGRRDHVLLDGEPVGITTTIDGVDGVDGAVGADEVHGPAVTFTRSYVFTEGETQQSTSTLRFRTEEEVRSSLQRAGFAVDAVFGGWRREPVGSGDGELLVLASTAGGGRPHPR